MVEEDLPPAEPPPRPAVVEPAFPPATAARAVAQKPAAVEAPPARAKEGPATRSIEPVRARFGDILEAWRGLGAALREQDLPRAQVLQQRVLSVKAELGIENLPDLAAAEVRASSRALDARAPGDAVLHAELAVALAPALASAHVALAEARLAREPRQVFAALKDLALGLAAAAREPEMARSLVADALGAALAAAFAAAALVLALLLLRRLRLALHDFAHLPVVRHATPLQAGFIGLALLALPVALRLGPAALLATLALAAAPYLTISERAVATAALVAVSLLPRGAREAAQLTAWAGTAAEDVYLLEQGADDGRVAARLEARAADGELPPAVLLALGRHHKRRGDLEGALRWYEAAGTSRADALVNVGNVRFLTGDLLAAKASYLAAIDRAGASGDVAALAAAHYDLSKIFLRQSALEQAQEARRKAALEAPALVERYGSDEDFRANRWLIDVPLSAAEVSRLAGGDASRAVEEAALAFLAGPFPRAALPWELAAVALALWPIGLARRRLAPASACERCGRPACRRCGTVTGQVCGQCVNVFLRKGVVDARDRLRKEAEVRRYARRRRVVPRALAVLGGGAGHVWRGDAARGALVLVAIAFFVALAALWRGLLPGPHPSPWLARSRLALGVPLALTVWALGARDLFRRTRGRWR
jgi:hypothetical protein